MDLSGLNESQKKAVQNEKGPLLVLAGAGSGKTKTLTYRAAYLLEQGVAPESLLVLTFTNKAADEMKTRAGLLLSAKPDVVRKLVMGTFHSICARFLRHEAGLLGRNASFSIYDRDDQLRLLKMIIKNLGIDLDMLSAYSALDKIQGAKNNLLNEESFAAQAQTEFDTLISHVYREYQRRLLEANAFDFDDLITQFVFLLESQKDTLLRYQAHFTHILVDEYQDTNAAQYRLVTLLSQQHGNLFLVADDWQSIYSFRNADISNVLNFTRDWADAKIVLLEENYRSTKNILLAAQGLIKKNATQIKKQLWTQNPQGAPVFIKGLLSETLEAEFVVSTIKYDLLKKGVVPSDIAIFFRTNLQSLPLEEALIKNSIPYQTHGLMRFYERKEIKDIIAYLRILQNPYDNVSLSRVINLPPRGLGAKTAKHILAYKEVFEKNMVPEELRERLGKAGNAALKDFLILYARLREAMEEHSLEEFITFLIKETGYSLFIAKDPAGEERAANLEELRFLASRQKGNAAQSLATFLEQVALFGENEEEKGKGLHVMTVHAAKGLEFPIVFITGLEYGVFPHYKSISSQSALEEERRLCYVAMTRAKERLFLTFAQLRRLYGRVQANPPSNFLDEIPEEFITKDTLPI